MGLQGLSRLHPASSQLGIACSPFICLALSRAVIIITTSRCTLLSIITILKILTEVKILSTFFTLSEFLCQLWLIEKLVVIGRSWTELCDLSCVLLHYTLDGANLFLMLHNTSDEMTKPISTTPGPALRSSPLVAPR